MAAQLGLAPGFHFVPTDVEVVRLHLLPCIQDQPQPPNDIIVDDPLSAPPWALLEKHGRKHEAFFFAVGQALNAKGNRQKRTCEGHGTWEGQGKRKRQEEGKEKETKKRMRVSVCGRTKEIEWEKYALSFHERGVKGSTGWVMHEYSITSPPEFARSPMRVYCIRHSGHGKNAKKHNRDADDWGSDGEDDDEVDDATLATTSCTAEEDPALFIGAGNDQDLPALVEDNATTWCAAEEDPALFIDWSEKWG
ncbi:NAC domain-containing protein 83-like [Miscanthus floridulus]|uniref:NAC domain-containing protein 83-like n=1 Tax=Miscanthus floridulus TaxID=154761 RepID=UPI00345986F0